MVLIVIKIHSAVPPIALAALRSLLALVLVDTVFGVLINWHVTHHAVEVNVRHVLLLLPVKERKTALGIMVVTIQTALA